MHAQIIDVGVFEELHGVLEKTVDFEASRREDGRICIMDGVTDELDEMRATYDGMGDFLTRINDSVLADMPYAARQFEIHTVYFPQLGYLIAVRHQQNWNTVMEALGEGFELQFHTDEVAYLKNHIVRQLDEEHGDIYGRIIDHENAIVRELTTFVMSFSSDLIKAIDLYASLDCLLSLAVCALENDYCRPKITANDERIIIRGGRHPLQEVCVDVFIPNDTKMAMPSSATGQEKAASSGTAVTRECRMQVVTGENGSGKSVYLKQVALIAYMAQIGSFVPAREANIGIVDAIFSRISSLESSSVGQSTFLIDLCQVSPAFRQSTSRSLILLDEFGKSTNAEDGLAILGATLRHFSKLGDACPRTLVSTHFSEIARPTLLPPSRTVRYLRTEVVEERPFGGEQQWPPPAGAMPMQPPPPPHSTGFDPPTLVCLYKIKDGAPTVTRGIIAAQAAGVSVEVCRRASEILDALASNRYIEPVGSQENIRRVNRHRRMAQLILEYDDSVAGSTMRLMEECRAL